MFYQEAIDYIKNIERSGSDYGLERMRELLALLGNPDDKLKFVHVAGTNGKGSVTAYLTSALKEAGYKVGTYNSPSVFCYNERWLIDGNPLCDEDVARYMTVVRECIESEKRLRSAFGLPDFNPTAFEIETAVAMLAFFDKECDICVLEVGLGGRWDATNAISQKELAVITPIGLDHCAILGDTLSEIASEKSAIIKKDCVTVEQCDEVMKEIYHPYVFDENGNEDSYIVYKNNTATRYDMKGEFLEDWVNYRHHPNGLCHRCLPDGGTEAFYMCEGSECDSHDEFLEENFEIVADRCRERFGKKRPDLDQALYVQFFGEQYRMITESPLAQNEFCNYEELDVCDIMAIDDDTFFRYMARDLLLRLRLPNDGETEKKLTCNLKEFVGAR